MKVSLDAEKYTVEVNARIGKNKEKNLNVYIILPKEINNIPALKEPEKIHQIISSDFFYHISKIRAPLLSQMLRDSDPNYNLPLFVRAFKLHVSNLTQTTEPKPEKVKLMLEEMESLLMSLRSLHLKRGILKTYRDADELSTFYMEQYLLGYLNKYGRTNQLSFLAIFIKKHQKYREEAYGTTKKNSIRLMKRKEDVLCRFIGLTKTSKKSGAFREQLAFSLSAFLSMFFTTAVVFYAQIGYDSLSFNVFIVLCLSYIFKDRFKELFRNYVLKKLNKGKDQYRSELIDNRNDLVATCGEMVESYYHGSEANALWDSLHQQKKYRNESIIHFRKQYQTQSSFMMNFSHIRDNIVFNLESIISQLPSHELQQHSYDGNTVATNHTKQIYDLKILISMDSDHREYYRLKATSSGIKKIKEIMTF